MDTTNIIKYIGIYGDCDREYIYSDDDIAMTVFVLY